MQSPARARYSPFCYCVWGVAIGATVFWASAGAMLSATMAGKSKYTRLFKRDSKKLLFFAFTRAQKELAMEWDGWFSKAFCHSLKRFNYAKHYA